MRKISRILIIACLSAAVISLSSVMEAKQTPRFRSSDSNSSIDSSRMKQLRQEMRDTKDPVRRRELNKELLKLRMSRFKNFRGFKSRGGTVKGK